MELFILMEQSKATYKIKSAVLLITYPPWYRIINSTINRINNNLKHKIAEWHDFVLIFNHLTFQYLRPTLLFLVIGGKPKAVI